MTKKQGIQIMELRKQGLGYKRIASILNISSDSVRIYCRIRKLDGYIGLDSDGVRVEIQNRQACAFCGRS